jgi:hypothetical protein
MIAVGIILCCIIDNDWLSTVTNLVADRGLNLEFAAGLESKGDLVAHGTGDPSMFSDAGHGSEAKTCRAAHDLKDAWYGVDPGYGIEIVSKGLLHVGFPDQKLARIL